MLLAVPLVSSITRHGPPLPDGRLDTLGSLGPYPSTWKRRKRSAGIGSIPGYRRKGVEATFFRHVNEPQEH